MTTRRSFLKKTSLCVALAGASPALSFAAVPETRSAASDDLFRLGIAGFSFVNFKLEPSLEMMKKMDVHYLCIKDFHLPYASTADEIAAFHEKLK